MDNLLGIGGKAKVLGKVLVPAGFAGVNGTVEFTVVDNPQVLPLTPVSLLTKLGSVVDLPDSQITFKHLNNAVTNIHHCETGHISHDICEFSKKGWTIPDGHVMSSCSADFYAKPGGQPLRFPFESEWEKMTETRERDRESEFQVMGTRAYDSC